MRERFYVELSPGYVRLRHQLGLRTKFGRRGLTPLEARLVRAMEAAEDAGALVMFGEPDPDDLERLLAQDRQNQEAADEALAAMDPWEVQEHQAALDLEAANAAATERLGRGAKGMSERSRREMWRWVLSLPFEMLGDRPLWITLTYPGDWRRWLPDGPTLEC